MIFDMIDLTFQNYFVEVAYISSSIQSKSIPQICSLVAREFHRYQTFHILHGHCGDKLHECLFRMRKLEPTSIFLIIQWLRNKLL